MLCATTPLPKATHPTLNIVLRYTHFVKIKKINGSGLFKKSTSTTLQQLRLDPIDTCGSTCIEVFQTQLCPELCCDGRIAFSLPGNHCCRSKKGKHRSGGCCCTRHDACQQTQTPANHVAVSHNGQLTCTYVHTYNTLCLYPFI